MALKNMVYVNVFAELGAHSVAVCRSMKRAYQSAVQNAFSHLLLVILDNGKVFVDVNSTISDATSVTLADEPFHSEILTVSLTFDMVDLQMHHV